MTTKRDMIREAIRLACHRGQKFRFASGCLAAVSLLALACAPAAAPIKGLERSSQLAFADPWPTSSPESWECPRDLDKAERDERGIQWPGVKGACDSCTTSGGQWVPERYMPDVGPHGLQRLAWSCAQCYRTERAPGDPIFERCRCGSPGCDPVRNYLT
ncbi:MAG: hypothetical protein ACTSX8_06065, partial [Alphaproteobacteria bacterium]